MADAVPMKDFELDWDEVEELDDRNNRAILIRELHRNMDEIKVEQKKMEFGVGLSAKEEQLYTERIMLLESLDDVYNATEWCDTMIETSISSKEYKILKADIFEADGQHKKAAKCFKNIGAKENMEIRNKWLMKKSEMFTKLGNAKLAVKNLDRVLETDPEHPLALFGRGAMHEAQYNITRDKKDLEKALECYAAAARNDPGVVHAWEKLGYMQYRLDKYEDAVKSMGRALRIGPDTPMMLSTMGAALDMCERYKEAIKYCDKAIKLDPKNSEAWASKSHSLYMLGRYEEAADAASEATKIDPHNSNALVVKDIARRLAKELKKG